MPDDVVTYKVELDDSDLGAQLDSVRERIDSAISANSFRPESVTQNVSMPDIKFPEMSPIPSTFGAQLDTQFWGNINSTSGSDLYGVLGSINNKLDSVMATSYGGFQRAVSDFRGFAGMHDDFFSMQMQVPKGMTPNPGLWTDVVRAYTPFDGGFEYTGPITPGAMRRQSVDRMQQRMFDFGTDWGASIGGAAAGAAIGSVVPGVGTIAGAIGGFSVATTAEFLESLFTSRQVEREQMGEGFMAISRATGSGLIKSEAEALAGNIQKTYTSMESRARGFDVGFAEENIVAFANAGGYTNVRGPEEFKKVTVDMLDNIKRVAADLNVQFTEAAQYLGVLNQNFIASPEMAANFSMRAKSIAALSGGDAESIFQSAMQSATALKGAGFGAEAGMMMAFDSRYQAERMATFGNLNTRRLINEFGGPEGASGAIINTLTGWGMSDEGTLGMAAMLGGYNGKGGLPGMFSAVGNLISGNPAMILALQSEQARLVGQLGAQGADVLGYTAMDPWVNMLKNMPGATDSSGKIYADVLAGQLSKAWGISSQQANLIVNMGLTDQKGPSHRELAQMEAYNQLQREADINTPIPGYKRVLYGAAEWADQLFDDPSMIDLRRGIRGGLERATDSISDFFSGRTTVRTEHFIENANLQRNFKDFQDASSPFMKERAALTQMVISNPDSPEAQAILNTGAIADFNYFLEKNSNISRLLKDSFDDSGISNQKSNIMGSLAIKTFGLGVEDRTKVVSDVINKIYDGNSIENINQFLGTRTSKDLPVHVDRKSKEYIQARDLAEYNIDYSNLKGKSVQEVRDLLAKSAFNSTNKTYDSLTSEEKAALTDIVDGNPEAKKLANLSAGPMHGVDDELSIERAVTLAQSEKYRTQALAAIDAVEKTASSHASERVNKLQLGEGVLLGPQMNTIGVKAEIENITNKYRKSIQTGDYMPEDVDNLIKTLGAKGDKRSGHEDMQYAAALEVKKASDGKLGDIMGVAVMASAMTEQDRLVEEKLRATEYEHLEAGPLKEGLKRAAQAETMMDILSDKKLSLGGQIDVAKLKDLEPALMKQILSAEKTDETVAAMHRTFENSVTARRLISITDQAALGISTVPDEVSKRELFRRLHIALSGEGIPVKIGPSENLGPITQFQTTFKKELGKPWYDVF